MAKNLKELDDAGLRFIVGSRQTKAPHDLATHFRWNGEYTERAMKLTGFKGYVTNIPAGTMPAAEVIGSYHDLWHVEQSFRMSKTDLRARPIFHRKTDAIEAHLTVVFTALAVSRLMQDAAGVSLKKIITTLRPLREFTGRVGGQDITFDPEVTGEAREIADELLPDSFSGH